MDFRIHHVGLPFEDPERAFGDQQQQLGLQHVCTFVIPGKLVNYFSGLGCDVTIHSMGDPLYPYQQELVDKHGRTWEHINFLVDDVEAEFERLVSKGARPCIEPGMMAHAHYGSVADPDFDVVYELMWFRDDDDLALGEVDLATEVGPDDLRLGQISLVTPDLRGAEARLAEYFGLRTVYEHIRNDSGFVLMADPYWNSETHNFVVKVWGGPRAGERERALLAKKGPHFDCVVLYADDIDAAYRRAVQHGARPVSPPRLDDTYAGAIAWITDREDNDIAIMTPPSTEVLEEAFGAQAASRVSTPSLPT